MNKSYKYINEWDRLIAHFLHLINFCSSSQSFVHMVIFVVNCKEYNLLKNNVILNQVNVKNGAAWAIEKNKLKYKMLDDDVIRLC